jgi:hypothetical protein
MPMEKHSWTFKLCIFQAEKLLEYEQHQSAPQNQAVKFLCEFCVLLYGGETWFVTNNITQKLQAFVNRCLRNILEAANNFKRRAVENKWTTRQKCRD